MKTDICSALPKSAAQEEVHQDYSNKGSLYLYNWW